MMRHLPTVALALIVSGNVSRADIEFTTRFPVNEIDASPGAANTAKSFAAAARMAHVGFTGTPPPDEATIIVQCAVQTGTSSWPGSCDPTGMVKALDAVGGSWVNDDVVSADSSLSVNAQVSHLTSALHTPNVVPLFGHADHWAVNYAIFEDSLTGDITEFDFFDGGPAGERDGSRTGYFNGPQFTDPTTWKSVFFKVITTVPVTDRFYNHYLNLWEPPPGFPDPRVAYTYRASPGVLGANVKPTAALARDSALRALDAAGFARHPGEWAMLSASTPTLAQEVRGVYPDGRDWDYFVVPFVNRANLVVGLVQLEHDTLRFQMATVLDNPVPLFKLSSSDALQAAQRALRAGESIGPGVLTWDPAAGSAEASSPMLPYYEFPVYRAGQPIGSQIVHSEDGRVRALTAAQMSRRLQP